MVLFGPVWQFFENRFVEDSVAEVFGFFRDIFFHFFCVYTSDIQLFSPLGFHFFCVYTSDIQLFSPLGFLF